ncbi:MAG TPA: DHA2 family efflux MFS transporter permease subunit [Stellaceae bacterium]|jgi:DHA2 family multidrug resistance protein
MTQLAGMTVPRPAGRTIATAGLMIATAMQAADALIVNVALPRLEADLGGGPALGAWVLMGYLCATAVLAPLTGWLRRRYGARRLFPLAIWSFVAASLLCSAAPTAIVIIIARILQGAGGGVLHPLSQAILLDIHPKERHGRMLAIWGSAVMVGPILAPLIGGVITDLSSWRWVFVINLPLGILSIWCLRRVHRVAETSRDLTIDGFGIVLLTAGVGALQLCLQRGAGQAWFRSPEIVSEAAIAGIAFALLALRARRSGFAVFRAEVFRDRNFATASFYNFMLSALLFSSVMFVPLLAEGPFGLPATLAGALVVPRAVLMTAMILCIGQIIGRVDMRILLASGWLMMAAGLAILSTIGTENGALWIIIGSAIQAIGAGMLYTPISTLAFSTLAPELRTDATGLFSLLRQLAYASGVALMTATLEQRVQFNLARQGAMPHAVDAATLAAYRDCFRMMAVTAVVVIPGIFMFRVAPRRAAAQRPA